MKKVLILSSLLLSLSALADAPVPEVDAQEAEPNFVIKGIEAIHTRCEKARAKYANAEAAKAQWEAVKQDCQSLPQIPQEPAAPKAADLPKTDL